MNNTTVFVLTISTNPNDCINSILLDRLAQLNSIGVDVHILCQSEYYSNIKTILLQMGRPDIFVFKCSPQKLSNVDDFKSKYQKFSAIKRYKFLYFCELSHILDDDVLQILDYDVLTKLNSKHTKKCCLVQYAYTEFGGGNIQVLFDDGIGLHNIDIHCKNNLFKKSLHDYLKKIKTGK